MWNFIFIHENCLVFQNLHPHSLAAYTKKRLSSLCICLSCNQLKLFNEQKLFYYGGAVNFTFFAYSKMVFHSQQSSLGTFYLSHSRYFPFHVFNFLGNWKEAGNRYQSQFDQHFLQQLQYSSGILMHLLYLRNRLIVQVQINRSRNF